MPSWLALEFAELFFETVEPWRICGNPVSFSAGLVICDRKTPIRQAKSLAGALVDSLKNLASPQPAEFGRNMMQIEIFESLTLPSGNLDDYRVALYAHGHLSENDPSKAKWTAETNLQLAIAGSDIGGLIDRIARLQGADGFPRSQLYKLLEVSSRDGTAHRRNATEFDADGRRVMRQDQSRLQEVFAVYSRRAGAGKPLTIHDIGILRPGDGKPAALALDIAMLAMLWDYVRPIAASGNGGSAQ